LPDDSGTTPPPAGEAGSLESLVARLPAMEYQTANAPIWGRVLSLAEGEDLRSAGTPVAGVRVEAWPVILPGEECSLEERVRAWMEEEHSYREGRHSTVTDAEGRFEFRELVHAHHRIEARHEDFTIVPAQGEKETYRRPGDYVAFVASRGRPYEIEIDVIAADGRQPETALIEVSWPESRSISLWKDQQLDQLSSQLMPRDDQQGFSTYPRLTFRWSPSRRSLRVASDCELVAHGTDGSASEKAAISLSRPQSALTLRLLDARSIFLDVVYPPGSERRAVRAALMRIDPDRPPSVERFARAAKWIEYSGADRAIASDVPEGTYMVGCEVKIPERQTGRGLVVSGKAGSVFGESERGDRVDAWTMVEVSVGPARACIALPEPSPEGGILARVLGLGGEVLGGIRFQIECTQSSRPAPRREYVLWERCPDGNYVLWPQHDLARAILSGEKEGAIDVIASHESLGEARGTVIPGDPPLADISFQRPGFLELELGGAADAKPVSFVHVALRGKGGGLGGPQTLRSASTEGMVIEYGPITPGEYEASITLSCGGGGSLELASHAVTIAGGETARLAVAVPVLYPLEVRFPGGRGGRLRHVIVGEGLRCRLMGGFRDRSELRLPAGSYELTREEYPGRGEETLILRFQVPEVGSIEIPEETGP